MSVDHPTDDAWDGERACRWVEQAAGLERQLAPIGELLFAAARLQPGEVVVDVGCGTGPTTYDAAAAVGVDGRVVGVDVSAAMLEAARASAPASGSGSRAPVDWVTADVTTWEGEDGQFDVVISRFGVMFFDDPPQAFANLARMTVPGGRLAMVVWPRRTESAMFEVPLAATMRKLAADGVAVEEPPADEGPFSLSDRVGVTSMLTAAEWSGIEWAAHDLTVLVGGGLAPADAAKGSLAMGPARVVTAELDDATNEGVLEAITSEYEHHTNGDGHVELAARVVVVTADRAAPA